MSFLRLAENPRDVVAGSLDSELARSLAVGLVFMLVGLLVRA